MTNRLLKGLAVAAGTGLAVGFTSARTRTGSVRYRVSDHADRNGHAEASPAGFTADIHSNGHSNGTATSGAPEEFAPEDFLDIEPLLDRLERLEARVDEIAQQRGSAEHGTEPVAPSVSPATHSAADNVESGKGASDKAASDEALARYAESLADLERRVEQNTRELELLRRSVAEAEARMAESVTSVERRLEQTREELPLIIGPQVAARIGEMQTRFTAEIEKSHQRTLEVFERALDEKISSRIGAIEKALADQAGSIETLNTRAAETDSNLQRLVTAIEKLCERAHLFPSGAEKPPTPLSTPLSTPRPSQSGAPAPFESQLNEAIEGNPPVPVLRKEEPVAQPEPKKSWSLFRNLIVAGFGFLASRFVR